jgi:putative hydrolase of the HAD superfamily
MRTQAVLFDLYETLVTELNAPVRRASSLAAKLSVDEQAYKREWKARRPDIVQGRCTFRDALAQIASRLGRAADEVVLEELRSERVTQKSAVLRAVEPDVLAAVGELRSKGLKLAVVSNAFAEDVAGWTGSPLRALFDVTLFSCASGLVKPDPKIYLAACRALGVTPQRALFVGDGADEELEGARAAGLSAFRALWFASRWPQTTIRRDDPGLWRAGQVVDEAIAA